MPSVRALVLPAEHRVVPPETLERVEGQTRRPDEVVAVRHVAALLDAVSSTLEDGMDWLWFLDGSALPEPDALEHLVGAIGRLELLPEPAVLTSRILLPGGSLDPDSLPVPHIFNPDLIFAAFDQRLLPVRVVRRGSMLVHRRGIERCGLPNLGFVFFGDDLVWNARLLRPQPGLLVPGSVVVRTPASPRIAARRRRASILSGGRLLLSDGLLGGEKPWFAGRLAEETVGVLRRG